MMTPQEWKDSILKAVQRMSDVEYQHRSWFGHGPEVDSPDEMFCELFGDLQFEEFLRTDAGALSTAQQAAAFRLRDELDDFAKQSPTKLEAQDVFNDPRWQRIRTLAKAIIDATST
jgi:hypothetical protein